MSSAIMYKFRASTNFESLHMTGSSARLFDVKRAIVRAKKLDKSNGGRQLEFDLSVKNAMTNESYEDEGMLLPRGSRLIVQRFPAAPGNGLLTKIARADAGVSTPGGMPPPVNPEMAAARNQYDIVGTQDDDEFEDAVPRPTMAPPPPPPPVTAVNDADAELAKLQAITDQAGSISSTTISRSKQPSKFGPAIGGLPQPPTANTTNNPAQHHFKPHHNNNFHHQRPNADPELREQELRLQQQEAPKKRATGIPRTFLTPSTLDGNSGGNTNGDESSNSNTTINPNIIGFQALVNRGGGQSGTGANGKKCDLEYALKLTATTIPEHLQCGICAQVVKNAMLIPWDMEGRTACELCMRNGLAQNGFRCPLTGNDGVSPDDLLPNYGLRKAVDMFVEGVMKSMDEVVEQQEAVEEEERKQAESEAAESGMNKNEFEDEQKGVMTRNRRNVVEPIVKPRDEFGDDAFGDDAFGDDVFKADPISDVVDYEEEKSLDATDENGDQKEIINNSKKTIDEKTGEGVDTSFANTGDNGNKGTKTTEKIMTNDESPKNFDVNSASSSPQGKTNNKHSNADHSASTNDKDADSIPAPDQKHTNKVPKINRREMLKTRGPPAGYKIGPAGGATIHGSVPPPPVAPQQPLVDTVGPPGGMGGGRGRGRGRGNYQNFPGRGENGPQYFEKEGRGNFGGPGRGGGRFSQNNEPGFGNKGRGNGGGRGFRGGGRFGRGNFHEENGGRSGFPGRGGRGDFPGRGGRGGRGDFAGGRGNGQFFNHQDGGNQMQDGQYMHQDGNMERDNKRPRMGSGDGPNFGQPDGQFHGNWQQHGGGQGRGFNQGGRGFNERGRGFGQRGRGDFQQGGPGRGGRFQNGRGGGFQNGRGRSDFFRGRGSFGRGRF